MRNRMGSPVRRVQAWRGTRRRHSFLWHEYMLLAMHYTLGKSPTGSSNTYLAYKHDPEADQLSAFKNGFSIRSPSITRPCCRSSEYKILHPASSAEAIMVPS